MAQAAYCSQCKANVYVTADGRCPQGHGPESLSNYYDVPDAPASPAAPQPTAAPQPPVSQPPVSQPPGAQPAGAPGQPPKKRNTALIVVLSILAILVLCGIGSCAAGAWFFNNAADELTSDIESELDQLESELDAEFGDPATLSAEAEADLIRMVDYFYPGFEPESFYVVDTSGGPSGSATFHVIAAYANEPDFRITFFAYRANDEAATFDVEPDVVYYDDEAMVWWVHPQTREHALDSVFGPSGLMVESMLDQISADFVSAHPGAVITDLTGLTNVDLAFTGIYEEELEAWYEDFESFESTWKLDLASGDWEEIDFQEF